MNDASLGHSIFPTRLDRFTGSGLPIRLRLAVRAALLTRRGVTGVTDNLCARLVAWVLDEVTARTRGELERELGRTAFNFPAGLGVYDAAYGPHLTAAGIHPSI